MLLKEKADRGRFHVQPIDPLTVILINALVPFLNTLFPSGKTVLFTFLFVFFILLLCGRIRRFFMTLLLIAVFFGLYRFGALVLRNTFWISWFRMMLLFLPNFILAHFLITEYHSSEILSALQRLHLPKIFVIGLTVTIRYIPTFRREFSIIRSAMHCRGVSFTVLKPLRTFEYLLVPQLFRCVALSSELTAAALTKGIDAPIMRTGYFTKPFSWKDYGTALVFISGYGLIIGGLV